jgi:S1-C subfamily serine protease
MIAGFDHKYLGHYFSTTHLRVNATTQRGEMGAPLLNLKGEVVGVVVGSLENGSSCYAIPVEAAEKIQRDFVRFGEVRHGWIGANVREASARVQGSRAEITDLSATTPASDSGLRPGDILLQVGKVRVHEPEDALDASFFLTAGDAVPITVVRGNETLTFTVQADFHPASKRPPLLAAPTLSNRAIPLSLESGPQRTP